MQLGFEKPKKFKWHERLRLLFAQKQYIWESDLTHHCSINKPPDHMRSFYWEIVYKTLKGKVFILEINEPPPPHHVGCRCRVVPIEDEPEGNVCQDCGRTFKTDLMIPNKLWEEIRPAGKPKFGGLLCGCCIMKKLEELKGFSVFRLKELK